MNTSKIQIQDFITTHVQDFIEGRLTKNILKNCISLVQDFVKNKYNISKGSDIEKITRKLSNNKDKNFKLDVFELAREYIQE